MPPQLPNQFLTEPGAESRIRPFVSGIHEHQGTVATILLYTGESLSKEEQEHYESDYLTDLTMTIKSLQSESVGSVNIAPPELPGGRIAAISLDERAPNDDNYYGVFNNFSLLSVNERHEEIIKLHQNFSQGWNAFFFGEKPVIYNFGGVFIDSMEYPYYQEFMIAYHKYLSGRKCIENRMQFKMMYDGKIISGYMINVAVNSTVEFAASKAFNFSVLVRDIQWVRFNLIPVTAYESNIIGYTPKFNALTNIPRLSGQDRDVPFTNDGSGDIARPSLT